MKNKNNVIFYLILTLILFSVLNGIKLPTTHIEPTIYKKEKSIENKLKEISFYKETNLRRYQNYQKKNKNLSLKQIITDVNIGLDKPYYTNVRENTNLDNLLILVNKYNSLPKDYIPKKLETINEKYSRKGLLLVNKARIAFEKMSEAASKENLRIIAMSTYRSYEYQKLLYTNYSNKDGQEKADTYSARAGHSEHQTGLAVDVYNINLPYTSFEETEEFIWMQKNAHKYGFILRYPKQKTKQTGYQYESWHYRYVGKKIATEIYNNNITYDEYYIQNLDTKKG